MSGVLDLSMLTLLEVPKLDLVTASGELSTLAGIDLAIASGELITFAGTTLSGEITLRAGATDTDVFFGRTGCAGAADIESPIVFSLLTDLSMRSMRCSSDE